MIETLTMAEINQAETIAGKSIQQLSDTKAPNARLMTAVAFVIAKRADNTLNFEKFEGEATLETVMKIIGEGDEETKK
jgi:hypothetical protein